MLLLMSKVDLNRFNKVPSLRFISPLRLSLIEPGPVHTEFELKMMDDVAKMEFPGADADTVRYFKDVYMPSSIDIFEAMGQMPEDIAKVSKNFLRLNPQ